MATDEQEEQKLAIRTHLSDAYSALEGAKAVQSFSAFTFEDALDAQAQRIEGPDTQLRPNALHRIDKIVANVQAAVEAIKALPPDAFVRPDDSRDVNSDP